MSLSETEGYPSGPEPALRRLDGQVVWHWRGILLGWTAALTVAAAFLARWADRWIAADMLPLAVAVLGLMLAVFWPPVLYRSWAFQLREKDLVVQRGVLTRATSIIPHRRIQHVDTRRDPVERRLGLARVVVYTAGIRGAEIAIPGLRATEAEALRDRLAELGGEAEGV